MCTAVLNKVWMKRKKCIFHFPNLFSLFSMAPASVFEICQNRNKNRIVDSFQSSEVWYFTFWLTSSWGRKRARVAILNILKTENKKLCKFGNISSDARVDKNPSWLILTARSNTERILSELSFEVISINSQKTCLRC